MASRVGAGLVAIQTRYLGVALPSFGHDLVAETSIVDGAERRGQPDLCASKNPEGRSGSHHRKRWPRQGSPWDRLGSLHWRDESALHHLDPTRKPPDAALGTEVRGSAPDDEHDVAGETHRRLPARLARGFFLRVTNTRFLAPLSTAKLRAVDTAGGASNAPGSQLKHA